MDEADRLLDLGFEETVNNILAFLPKQRRTGLFSATQTEEVKNLMRAGLRNPVCVRVQQSGNVDDLKTPVHLKNYYVICRAEEKFSYLIKFLKEHKKSKIIVFTSTCASVDYFGILLKK